MPQSLHQVYGHIVFSTKDRANLIHGEVEKELYAYIGGIVRDLGAAPIMINGMPDHVHLLIRASKKVADMDFIREVKSGSSRWMHGQAVDNFSWQAGYGWFGVAAKDLDVARRYVGNQKVHHEATSFQDELRKFLTQYEIEYDERYLWD